MARLALRGATLTLSSSSVFAFLIVFSPDMYLASLMSSDMTGKALQQRVYKSRREVINTINV